VSEVDPWDLMATVREGLLVLDSDLTIRFANRSFCDTFAVTPDDAVGQKLYEVGDGQWDIPELRTALETVVAAGKSIETFESTGSSRQSAGAQWCSTRAKCIGLATRYDKSSSPSKTSPSA
jgi:PAS domain-containing protein